ncbi:hypothetical protein RFI_25953, partial [Reticulomyxa filosa]
DSWNKDEKEESQEGSSEDDGLAEFDPKKKEMQANANSNVIDEPSSSDSEKKIEPYNPAGTNEEADVLVDEFCLFPSLPFFFKKKKKLIFSTDESCWCLQWRFFDANKYWLIGETQGDKYRMVDYGERYFQKDRHKKSVFKKKTVAEILQWESYVQCTCLFYFQCIEAFLASFVNFAYSKLNQQARQTWKNINSYTKNRKSSKTKTDEHADKLLRFALKAPEELRDEIFCQL